MRVSPRRSAVSCRADAPFSLTRPCSIRPLHSASVEWVIATQVESEQRLSFAVRVDSVGIGVSLVGHVAGRMTEWRPSVATWLTVRTLTGDSFTLPLRSLSWQRNCDTIERYGVSKFAPLPEPGNDQLGQPVCAVGSDRICRRDPCQRRGRVFPDQRSCRWYGGTRLRRLQRVWRP